MNEEYFFHIRKKRPEEMFKNVTEYYTENRCREYAHSKNMMRIQKKITKRALELLDIENDNLLILDAGSGPGFASFYLRDLNFNVIALDLIPFFFKYYDLRDINPIVSDMCYLPFRSNTFDGLISISALQWVYTDINDKRMTNNLTNLIKSFFYVLKPNSKAIIQFYPKNTVLMNQIGKLIVNVSRFKGNFIIDNPNNPKKRKVFLKLEKRVI